MSALVLLTSQGLINTIKRLFARLDRIDATAATELLNDLEHGHTGYREIRIARRAADEVWVTKDERRVRIGDMDRAHLAHTLALIVRVARDGKVWAIKRDGSLRCYDPTRQRQLDLHGDPWNEIN